MPGAGGPVDQEALAAYWDSLSERMESRLRELQLDSSSQRPAGYDGYEGDGILPVGRI